MAYVVKLSADYSRLKTKVEQAEETIKNLFSDMEKKDEKYSQKFIDLYNSRNKTNETLTELTTTIKMLVQQMDKQSATTDKHFEAINVQFEKLEKKIDEIKENK